MANLFARVLKRRDKLIGEMIEHFGVDPKDINKDIAKKIGHYSTEIISKCIDRKRLEGGNGNKKKIKSPLSFWTAMSYHSLLYEDVSIKLNETFYKNEKRKITKENIKKHVHDIWTEIEECISIETERLKKEIIKR